MVFNEMKNSTVKNGLRTLFLINPNRIAWVDVAKGIAILLVIIGHTVNFGSATRNFIFSFHMPLFFILSGYTFKLAGDFPVFFQRVKKLIRHLIYPSLIVSGIGIFAQWMMQDQHTVSALWCCTKRMAEALWWASGVGVHAHPALGALWFLFSLFWCKVIMDLIHLLFPGRRTGYIYVGIGLFGIAMGLKSKWLPQNMDVTFAAMVFIYIGILWRNYQDWLERHEQLCFMASVIIWVFCLNVPMYIEMAARSYPWTICSVVEAVCGSYMVCCLCKAFVANARIRYALQFIGMHTLLIFLVHHLDWLFFPVWQSPSVGIESGLRISVVLLISFIILYIKGRCYRKRII